MKDTKYKRRWRLYRGITPLAHGVLYRERNAQILWRSDSGWTAEQVSDIGQLFELFPDASSFNIEPPPAEEAPCHVKAK